ncbi:hypothetical protein NMY3_00365 [Candidatus Nitrosocosmicus oleophilus]|uniref:Uncharacterized protein n=1 Tax=Candidatus Nitrosocosmicus oleophilus TaxID=1353260 RepID=A0A654LW42_9ARCH|nr:hypothetical protein NMY3_00365 [Candidatus Nitrosocosmicus oleophilus]
MGLITKIKENVKSDNKIYTNKTVTKLCQILACIV